MAAGLGTILPGLIIKIHINGLKEKQKRSYLTILICSLYAVLFGLGAIYFMTANPFAYAGFVIGISLFSQTLLIKKEIK
jgi:hypothetical protein